MAGRFLADGLDGLRDEPRFGTPRTVDDARIEAVITPNAGKPSIGCDPLEFAGDGACEWAIELDGAADRRAFRLQPHRENTFKLSTDPDFVDKVRDLVGLYVTPPAHAIVLCVDEKSQIQALDRSRPLLPMRPGQIAKRTHDYQRDGTTSLFAALDIATGHVIGKCYPRHRATEFRKFLDEIEANIPTDLDVHLIMDNTPRTKPRSSATGWPSARAGMSTTPQPAPHGSIRSNASSRF